MDMLLAQLPNILLVNGVADIALGLDPTGHAMEFQLSSGAFKDVTIPGKETIASTFLTSMIIHGIVRIFAGRNIDDETLRKLAIVSYALEIFQGGRLLRLGGLSMPDGAVFIAAPIGAIALLLAYKKKQSKKD